MKAVALLFVPLILAVPLASAQETFGTIKVTVKQLEGGFRSTTITDPEKHTAEETVTYNDGKDAVGRTIPGKVLKKTVYQLGEDGIAVGATFYDGKGKVIYKANYTRDGSGRVTEAAFNSSDDRYLGKRVFVYTGSPTDPATQVIDYDANGQLIAQAQPAGPKSGKKRK